MERGKLAEQQAKNYLIEQGLIFVTANERYVFGELDLVMQDGDYWVFIEVKYRSNLKFGGAINALGHKKIQRLQKAANQYLQKNKISAPCRFDYIAIDNGQINWLKDVF